MGSILWLALTIPAVTHGGVGKHLWDITYMEFFWYFKVKRALKYSRDGREIADACRALRLLESNKLSSTSQLA